MRRTRPSAVFLRSVLWSATLAAVLLAGRRLVYALSPAGGRIALELRGETGGPRPLAVALVATLAAAGVASALLWLVSLGVRERARLEPAARAPRRLRLDRAAGRAAAFWVASSLLFAGLESYLHWRAGLGFHGLRCLLGPVHRNALPVFAALSLLVAAAAEAGEHLLAWALRTIALLRRRARRRLLPATPRTAAAAWPRQPVRAGTARPRAPPLLV